MVSVYAPTYYSPQEQKDVCFMMTCAVHVSVCEDDLLIVLGDFNARMGTATSEFESQIPVEWS